MRAACLRAASVRENVRCFFSVRRFHMPKDVTLFKELQAQNSGTRSLFRRARRTGRIRSSGTSPVRNAFSSFATSAGAAVRSLQLAHVFSWNSQKRSSITHVQEVRTPGDATGVLPDGTFQGSLSKQILKNCFEMETAFRSSTSFSKLLREWWSWHHC